MATTRDELLAFFEERITAELDRLDARDTGKGGVVLDFPDELPYGWAMIADEHERIYGPAARILEDLEQALPGETITDSNAFEDAGPILEPRMDANGREYGVEVGRAKGDHRGFVAAWEALVEFVDREPDHSVWNDFHEFTGIETEGGLGVIVLRTNAGFKWGFAPTGSDYSAFNSTHDFSERFDKAGDALEAAREFEATEATRSES